MPDGLVNQIG
ncbi:hypothetical protein S40285_04024 [Stachybotrys chlorohalonatus IBT 40285]|uniref:Uncharacterized protein n=1 Tax=Stachybotrys chlorohalonatus (strain IBT 40285) TaxID=1283841 RepID=A0A084R096_STAC4|nr:hypothetical protein S40285_04024 [Stachybotrys chlorohalonata IBT 40285]